uniref:ATP synthase complex subunit 8 n=1 Tax=Sillago japonica TaxID=43258 RepID=A0A0U2NXW2_9TELE|nr:ATP synthase F0 subunit 8 [Sillago japonica]ALJ11042.1 ATP synthase subunit 8 [Sillago japonica]ALK48412.1 ATP synthase F0 subunit 8 [Sillago japonica]QPQ74867.1 ATP synthase F0 subunit 8 [Sillago japonica]BAX03712.1 ATPase subunit 8 [Sillago japonica]BBU25947.1 ATPase subunit 8 [Sillago japonica]
MPQLNPGPWFMAFVFSWLVFLTIIPSKVLANSFPNEPASHAVEKMKSDPWSWPWH